MSGWLVMGCIFEAESARGAFFSGDILTATRSEREISVRFVPVACLFPSSSVFVRFVVRVVCEDIRAKQVQHLRAIPHQITVEIVISPHRVTSLLWGRFLL